MTVGELVSTQNMLGLWLRPTLNKYKHALLLRSNYIQEYFTAVVYFDIDPTCDADTRETAVHEADPRPPRVAIWMSATGRRNANR